MEDDDEIPGFREKDKDDWYKNCSDDIANAMDIEDRKKAAETLGPNWASIMSGCGDQ